MLLLVGMLHPAKRQDGSGEMDKLRMAVLTACALGVATGSAIGGANAQPAAPVSTDAPASLRQVITRYIDWRGGVAFRSLRSIDEIASLNPGSDEIWLGRQGRSREDRVSGAVRQVVVTSPEGSWSVNPSGQVRADPDAYESMRRFSAVLFGEALLNQDGATVSMAGTAHSGTQTFAWLKIGFGDTDSYNLLIDPISGALAAMIISEKGQFRQVRFGDWRVVDGVRMPFEIASLQATEASSQPTSVLAAKVVPGTAVTQVSKITTITLNRDLAPDSFKRPIGSRLSSFKANTVSSGWLDLDFSGATLKAPVLVDGRPVMGVLDTGAELSFVDKAFAASLGLRASTTIATLGSQNTGTASIVGPISVQAGSLSLTGLFPAAADLSAVASLSGQPLRLMLGEDLFNEMIVDIDFPHKRVAFLDPKTFAVPPRAIVLPLALIGRTRATTASVEGRPKGQFIVDLGDSGTVDLYPEYTAEQKLLVGRKVSQDMTMGVGGPAPETITTFKDVTIGGVSLANVPVAISLERPPTTSPEVGRIGLGVLSRFRVLVDFPGNRLFLIPGPGTTTQPFARDRLGLSMLQQGDKLSVVLVHPNSPAEAAGVKTGDQIIAIDGKAASSWGYDERRTLEDGPAGTRVEFTLASGVAKTITLADYY